MDSSEEEIKGFLRQTKVEVAKLETKIYKTRLKVDELQIQLNDKQELQAYLAEQVDDEDED